MDNLQYWKSLCVALSQEEGIDVKEALQLVFALGDFKRSKITHAILEKAVSDELKNIH